jgi:hypothetical protein
MKTIIVQLEYGVPDDFDKKLVLSEHVYNRVITDLEELDDECGFETPLPSITVKEIA